MLEKRTDRLAAIISRTRKPWSAGPGFLDELYSAKPAQQSAIHMIDKGFSLYVDWRACTAAPLGGVS
jgi:hypothetical protein